MEDAERVGRAARFRPLSMRFFFRRRVPELERVLLIESGSRHILEAFLRRFQANHPEVRGFDLVTCFDGVPSPLESRGARVWRVSDYGGAAARRRLLRELREAGHPAAAMLCSGEPIMTRWKWALAALLPVKVLVVNENADYFWLDRSNWKIIRHFVLFRAGLTGAGAVRTAAGIVAFPFVLAYLLGYTGWVHLRRALR
jgi:hypothetical protein